jgi:hypothetical protein
LTGRSNSRRRDLMGRSKIYLLIIKRRHLGHLLIYLKLRLKQNLLNASQERI